MTPITYVSEQPQDYSRGLDDCETLDQLHAFLKAWGQLAADALDAAPADEASFAVFRGGLFKERKGEFSGEPYIQRFGAILMPEILLVVSVVALDFKVPWGCAFIQLEKAGRFSTRDGRLYLN